MKYFIFVIIAISIFFTSCDSSLFGSDDEITGSNNIIKDTRSISDIKEISVVGQATVYYTQTDTPSLTVEADDNIVDKVITTVDGKRLTISLNNNYSYNDITVIIHVSSSDIDLMYNTGQATFFNTGTINTDSLSLHCVGQGNFTLSGDVENEYITVEGQANISNFNLKSKNCYVMVGGQAMMQVYASKLLSINVAGQATIIYDGNPVTVNQNIAGTGSVYARN